MTSTPPVASAPRATAAPPRSAVVRDDALLRYDFGPSHPMSPIRLRLTWDLVAAEGLLDRPGVATLPAPIASDQELEHLHTPEYIDLVRAASDPASPPERSELIRYGLAGDDVPVFAGMHEAAARIVGGSLAAASAIADGTVTRAVNVAGGMHHARSSQASGFCIYNDAALAIDRLLERGQQRVLYVDLDAHHGDGVERALWEEPRAITFSIHETGEVLFPGTGFVQDTGGSRAPGTAVNLPLPPRTGADAWLRALRAVLPALARAVRPTVIVSQHGVDAHRDDPLSDLRVTLEAQQAAAVLVRDLADELCEGRWLALGGGGYAVTDVVPRAWTHLVAIATGSPIDPEATLPDGYLDRARRIAREVGAPEPPAVRTYGDHRPLSVRDWGEGYDPEDDLDRAVQACRRVAFPEWGLDPFFD